MKSHLARANQELDTKYASSECEPSLHLLIVADNHMDCHFLKTALYRLRSSFALSCVSSRSEIGLAMTLHRPDLALVSESFQDGSLSGLGVLREMHSTCPNTRVILLVKSDRKDLIIDAFRAGAKGVICRSEPLGHLRKCINVVHSGQRWLNTKHLEYVLDAFVSAAPAGRIGPEVRLTPREDEVVRLIVQGYTTREAASKLNLKEHTVSNYLFHIYDKLGISSRVELVLYCVTRVSVSLNGD